MSLLSILKYWKKNWDLQGAPLPACLVCALYLPTLLIGHLGPMHEVHPICVVPHVLLPSLHRSMQFVWFLMVGYPFISSDPLALLVKLDRHFLTNSLWMLGEVRRSVPSGLSAVNLYWFTTPWSCKLVDVLVGLIRACLETWRRIWSEIRDTLRGWEQAKLDVDLEAIIDQDWSTWRWEIRMQGQHELRLYSLVNSQLCECREVMYNKVPWEMRDARLAWSGTVDLWMI